MLLFNFSRRMVLMDKTKYLEMKFKIKYLEYYFMICESKGINISEDNRNKISDFILSNRYELLTQITYSFNKKKVRLSKKNMYELKEFSSYSDELKGLI